jgi:hypothetical protein
MSSRNRTTVRTNRAGMRSRRMTTEGKPICGHSDRRIEARGMCSSCYQKKLRRGELKPIVNDGTCAHCQQRPKLRYGVYCRPCKRVYDAAQKYGLTEKDWERLWLDSRGECGICACELEIEGPNRAARPAIDHDHETGKIRGLLCCCCNAGLGQFRDDVDSLRCAIAWLKKHAGPADNS